MSRVAHDPIGNLAAMLARWINDPKHHSLLAEKTEGILKNHQEMHLSKAAYAAPLKNIPLISTVVEYAYPDRVADIRKQFPTITPANALDALYKILNEGKWVQSGHTLWAAGSPSLNTQLMEEIVNIFRASMREIAASDSPNDSGFYRKDLQKLAEDFENHVIVIQRDAERLFIAVKAAAARSDMSHRNLAAAGPA